MPLPIKQTRPDQAIRSERMSMNLQCTVMKGINYGNGYQMAIVYIVLDFTPVALYNCLE